jgi:hypothetical protein
MWSLLDYDGKTVIDFIPPDTPLDVVEKYANGRITILMTLDNSPAWLGAIYQDGKFVKKGKENG